MRDRHLLKAYRGATVALVRSDDTDLTIRQTAVLLSLIETPRMTVRAMAAHLHIQKPVVTRAVDRLSALGLAMRLDDPSDRRSILLSATPKGGRYAKAIMVAMLEVADEAEAA